jgi:hypothetical protein
VSAPARPATSHAALSLLGNVTTLLACSPVPYDSVVQTVGPLGGTIDFGSNSLVIPPGALDTNTTITAVVPADTIDEVRFAPQGLVFAQPALLAMSYANCPVSGILGALSVVYVDDALSILEVESSSNDTLHFTITGRIRHFSGYAVAY